MILKRKVDNAIEEKIITGLIVSDKFCRDVIPLIDLKYFVVSYSRTVASWCIAYFKQYKEAPSKQIQEIFIVEKVNLKEEEANIISIFLTRLSSNFETDNTFNVEYLFDKTIEYFRKRTLKIAATNINQYLEIDRLSDAEKEIEKFKIVRKQVSNWINPFDEKEIKKYFIDEADKSNVLFSFPGDLGKMIGSFERDSFWFVLAPSKKGKTWWLQEVAIQALLEKLKVVYVSLEMSAHKMKKRIYKRISALGDESKEYIYPCFDCLRNQDDSCNKIARVNPYRLLDEQGKKPKFSVDIRYKPCTVCRGKKDFVVESWFRIEKRGKFKEREILGITKGMKNIYGGNLRVIAYPAYSANLSRIKYDLDDLEYTEGFIPDVVITDYLDITAPEDTKQTGRERSDETWKMGKNISSSKHCLHFTASQSNRASFKKKNVTQIDTAEDIRKIAHADGVLSLNQLPQEKRDKIIRVGLIAERDGEFDEYKTCMVLQQLELGQVFLDSQIIVKTIAVDSEDDEEDSVPSDV
jgi:hypothetical protein